MTKPTNRCASCGQFAGKGHRCPTVEPPSLNTVLTITGMEPRPERRTVDGRVSRAREYLAQAPTIAYHGTSTGVLGNIITDGSELRRPFITPNEDIAAYYAEEAADMDGTEPILLAVPINDPSLLRYDGAAMDEPVMVDEDQVQDVLNRTADENPDWDDSGYLLIPQEEWYVSWEGAQSAWYDGSINNWEIHNEDEHPNLIKRIQHRAVDMMDGIIDRFSGNTEINPAYHSDYSED